MEPAAPRESRVVSDPHASGESRPLREGSRFLAALSGALRSLLPALPCSLLCMLLVMGAAFEAAAQSRTIGFEVESLDVSESGTDATATLSVELSAGTGPVVYRICLEDGTATLADNDYATWTVGQRCVDQGILAGESSGSVQVSLPADTKDEPEETFTARLSLPATVPGLELDSSKETLAIVIADDDPTVVRLFRDIWKAVAEGTGYAFFSVELGRTLEAGEYIEVPLVLSGSGITKDDFSLSFWRSSWRDHYDNLTPVLVFSGGSRRGSLVVEPEEDGVDEGDYETLTVSLGSNAQFDASTLGTNVGGGADPHGTENQSDMAILDVASAISVSGGADVTEGETAEFTFTASPSPKADVVLEFLIYDLPGVGRTWISESDEGLKHVTFPANATSVPWSVPTIDTPDAEGNGYLRVVLRGPPAAGYLSGTYEASVTILDNEAPPPPPPTPAVRIAGGDAVTEGAPATFTLTADPAPAGNIVVNVQVVDSGDFAGSGQAGLRTATIGASGAVSLSVATVEDGADEPDGTITATVDAGEGYKPDAANRSASVVVSDNDDPLPPPPPPTMPVVRIAGGDAITEGGLAKFTLTADPAPAGNVVVNVNVEVVDSGDFAGGGQAVLRTVTIDASGAASLYVVTIDDAVHEPDGSITATVSAGDGYVPDPANHSASVAVSDDDDAPPTALPEVTLSASPNTVTEGDSMTITASLSRTLASAVEIPLVIAPGTAETGDYEALAAIVIAENQSSGAGVIATAEDDDLDDETFTVALGTLPAGLVAGTPSSVAVIITDDTEVTAAEPDGAEIPHVFALAQNYPNPFNPQTTIRYKLPQASDVRLAVYNLLGHEVAVLVDGLQPAGQYAAQFGGADLPSGLYVYRLQAAGEIASRTMLLAK